MQPPAAGLGRLAGAALLAVLCAGVLLPLIAPTAGVSPAAAPVSAAPTLSATKSAFPPTGSSVQPGGKLRYQIHVVNSGADAATNLQVTDAAPAGTTLLASSFDRATVSGSSLTWTLPRLGPGQSANFAYEVQVLVGTAPSGPIVGAAQVGAAGVALFTTNQTSHQVSTTAAGFPTATGQPVPGAVAPPGVLPGVGPGGVPLPPSLPAGQPAAPAAPVTRSVSGSYNAVGGLTPTVYLPLVVGGQNGMSTAVTVFNASTQTNQVTVQLNAPDGAPGARDTVTLAPNGSATWSNVPAGFLGAAVLTGQAPIVAGVTFRRAGGDDMAYEGVPASAATGQGAATVYAPLLFRRANGWSTEIAVQNAGQAPAEVTIVYRSSDPAQPGVAATETGTVPLGGVRVFAQGDTPGLPDGFVGGAVIGNAGAQPLAAIVNMTNTANPAGMSYTGVYGSQAASTVRAPLLMKAHIGWDTGMQIQNVGAAATNVRVDYTASGQSAVAGSDTATLQPGESRTFFTPAAPALPNDFVGSAVATSDNGQPLAAVVNQTKYQLGTAMTYTALASGAPTLVAPLALKGSAGYSTGIQVQNLGTAPAQVTVQAFTEQGQPAGSQQDTIPVGGSSTYYLPGLNQIAAGFRGAVVITSTNGQPLGAIVNDVAYQ